MRMTSLDVIKLLLLEDRQLTTAEIGDKLVELDLPVPSNLLLLSETRIKFLQVLRLLESVGAIEPGLSVRLPRELRRPKKISPQERVRSNYHRPDHTGSSFSRPKNKLLRLRPTRDRRPRE